MTSAHFHLALNHIPVLGTILGALLLAYGVWRDQEGVQKASLGLLLFVGVVAIAVYYTGEPAEEIIEGAPGVSHDAIEVHESWGWYAFLTSIVTGIAALGALIARTADRHLKQWVVRSVLVLSLITSGVMVYTANLGGKVNHPELRGDQAAVETPSGESEEDE